MAALLAAGKTVLIPFGVQGYDLVFEDRGGFHRVQCKTAYMRNGTMCFDAYSRTGDRRDKLTLYEGRADYFGIYCAYTGKCYLIPLADVTHHQGWFRIDPTRNNQQQGIKWAAPYEIRPDMVTEAEAAEASGCGPEGRGFETPRSH
jgi:PD-(D/E)XK endonuclease